MRAAACSGFAHLLAKALVLFPGVARSHMHGAQVAYAILPMKIHRGESEEAILRYADWCAGLDIPVTLAQLGIGGVSRSELLAACREVAPAPTAELPYTPEELADSVFDADRLVSRRA